MPTESVPDNTKAVPEEEEVMILHCCGGHEVHFDHCIYLEGIEEADDSDPREFF